LRGIGQLIWDKGHCHSHIGFEDQFEEGLNGCDLRRSA
jgi:hypothetical protein